jgi:hypothetical protein
VRRVPAQGSDLGGQGLLLLFEVGALLLQGLDVLAQVAHLTRHVVFAVADFPGATRGR